jgi:hypothetical protein
MKWIIISQSINNMYYRTYMELITFCKYLPIRQLIAFKDAMKEMKNKEFLVATEVLKIRLNTKTYLEVK